MKRTIIFSTLSLLFLAGKITAQAYTPVPTTGYNIDAVAEGTTIAGTTTGAVDASNWVLYSNACGLLYTPVGTGLPNNGVVSAGTRTYQLQQYAGNNLLYIPLGGKDSLTFTSPAAYPSVSLLGFATEGTANMTLTVRYTDNTTDAFTGLTLADWFSGTAFYAGFDRASRTGNNLGYAPVTNPRMYTTDLNIPCGNQYKPIKRIIITNTTVGPPSTARLCFMAVSVNQPPYSVTSSTTSICTGGNATFSATGMSSYTWQPVGSFSGSNSGTVTVSPSSTTTYSLIGQNGPCPGGAEITVNVAGAVPAITFAGSTSTVCLGAAATISASGALGYTLSNGAANAGTFAISSTTNYTVTGINGCGLNTATITVTVTPLPVTATTANSLVCSGLSTTLNAGGATTYSWLPGTSTQTNLIVNPTSNTTYTVNGKTGVCIGSATIAVATKTNPIISISAGTTAVCAGSSTSLTASGGLTYSWNPVGSTNTVITISPSIPTLYSLTGFNGQGCSTTTTQVILTNPLPVMTATASEPLVCIEGSSTLTATGADTYLWSNSIGTSTTVVNPTNTTTYSVTGTSTAGCISSTMVTVNVFITNLTVTHSTIICKGTPVSLTAGGTDSYQWSTGSTFANITVTPTLTTAYTVTGTTVSGSVVCINTGTVNVIVNLNPTVTAAASPISICKNETATLTGAGASTYSWSTTTPTVGTSITVSPSADQTYTVSGTDVNGCKGTGTVQVLVLPCTGLQTNAANANNLSVYPNPAKGAVNIKSETDINLLIINDLGQHVRTLILNEVNSHQAIIDSLPAGIYFVTSPDNLTVKQKIVIIN